MGHSRIRKEYARLVYPSPASDYLAALYKAAAPVIDETFPIASDEFEYEDKLFQGFEKVIRGLSLINNLCDLEEEVWSKLKSESTINVERPCFPISSFGYELARDAVRIAEAFDGFTPDRVCDFNTFYELLYDYTYTSLAVEPLTIGDFFDYLKQALVLFADKDYSNETYLILAYIRDVNDPACDFSNAFHRRIMAELSDRYVSKGSEHSVIVERVYVGYLMSIVATDEGVEFWKYAEEYQLEGDTFDESYISGAIYENDKRPPNSAEEWLDIVSPVGTYQSDYNPGIALGRRSYSNIENARRVENAIMSKAQRFFMDYDA